MEGMKNMRQENVRKGKRGKFWSAAIIGIFAAFWLALGPLSMLTEVSADGTPVILVRTAFLASPTGSVNPHGEAEFELYQSGNRELEVEIEDVNLPAGTSLTAVIDGNTVGQIVLEADRRGRLKLKTELGQAVPNVNAGSTVQVRNGNTILVSGVFGGPTSTPTATPTGSPTGSPTVSPTASPSVSPTASPSPGNEFSFFAMLSGATLNGVLPRGFAEYEIHSSRTELEIRVSQVNLPGGAPLLVLINNGTVGQLIISGGEGRLRLRSDNGQAVPVVTAGTQIALKNGDATVLSGIFTGGGAGPNPSPSVSPTPQQGRFFEGHLSGAQMIPPVNTAARGEIKIFLNANETLATASGEYNLTSAQTSARILCEVGSTTNLIHDFGALGGFERHFSASFAVTPAQVQQLRTGLCYMIVGSVNFPNGEIRGRIRNDSGRSSDFDGDGASDVAVFRPSAGAWYIQNSAGFSALTFGGANDRLVSGDFDGDGRSDAAVYRDVNGLGVWEIKRSSDGGTSVAQFGLATDIPVRADFDGDGLQDLAVFRPSNGYWYALQSGDGSLLTAQFGMNGDRPAPGDLDGDGKTDIVVFRPSNGTWYWLGSRGWQFGGAQFDVSEDTPVTGDFDGDGRDDLTVYRPSTGSWYRLNSSNGQFVAVQFGIGTDVPAAADFDRDGASDVAVFRPSNGAWYWLGSRNGEFQAAVFGLSGDVPVQAAQ
jgi:hypothetical protein